MATTSTSNVPTTPIDNLSPSFIDKQFLVVNENIDILYQTLYPTSQSRAKKRRPSKASLEDKLDFIKKAFHERQCPLQLVNVNADAPMKEADPPAATCAKRGRGGVSNPAQAKESVGQIRAELRSSMNEDETKEPRYLLLSNGCVVWLLDLKLSKDQPLSKPDDVRPLPKIATLKLIQEHLPVSVGLFKLDSNAYMIGGQEASAKALDSCKDKDGRWGGSRYYGLCLKHPVKGTSRATYRFSRADKGILSASKCKNMKLQSPKVWPRVEEIDENIHVFDSAPSVGCSRVRGWIFSHEVLEHDGGWRKISPNGVSEVHGIITYHTVVGNCIYALASRTCLVFNSETEKWEKHDEGLNSWTDAFSAKHVWDILAGGIVTVRCAGEFLPGELAISERLYVLIALVPARKWNGRYKNGGTNALAYLVTSTGQVVCSQSLPHFFKGPMKPLFMTAGTMFKVDKVGKMMCTIANACAIFKGVQVENDDRDYLFINTFTVELLTGAANEVQKRMSKGCMVGALLELEFVNVVVRGRYIHEPDADGVLNKEGDLIRFVGMQACCL